jgi:hypothetical protein
MTSPIKPIMSCERFNDRLADLLERDLPEPARAEMEAHALACEACGPLLADLRRLRIDAANLEELAPSRDLWTGIAARIETPVVSIGTGANGQTVNATRRRSPVWIGLAAAALVAVTATTTYQIARQSFANQNNAAPASQPVMTTAALTPVVDTAPAKNTPAVTEKSGAAPLVRTTTTTPKPQAAPPATVTLASNTGKLSPAQTYDLEISRLRQVVDSRRNQLDSATVAVLEKNLHIIDDAIAQCRKALENDPSSVYLNESLTDALDNKVQLLRAAATLSAGL